MILRRQYLFALACACIIQLGHANDGLTQTTISVHAGGKAVAGLIFPIGAKVNMAAMANQIEQAENQTRYIGNVEGRVRPPGGQPIVMYGEEIVISTVPISAQHATAVRDIEAMAGPDQLYRGRAPSQVPTQGEWKQQQAIDAANMKRLGEIIEAHGWPGVRFAGAASQTAFLVLQHADAASQRKYLPLLREAVKRSDALGAHLALLEDRVRIAEGKPQLYGSQLTGNPLRLEPIEDEANVDERRRSVGLEPLSDYAKHFGVTYSNGAQRDGAGH